MEKSSVCETCKTWEDQTYWKHFSTLHFFMSLCKDFHHQLVLPVKFAEKMVAKLPEKVSIIGPSATVWEIEVIKKTDSISFGGVGWKEFVKAYDLQENNFLVFKCTQNSCFEVLIFDPESSCEKEASYFVKQCKHTKKVELENTKKRTFSETFSVEDVEDENNDNNDDSGSEFVVSERSRSDNDKEPQRRRNPTRTPRKHSKPQFENVAAENGAPDEPSHSSGREQNIYGFTAKRGRSKKQLSTQSSREPAFQSAENTTENYRRSVTEIEKENVRSRAVQGLTETSFMSVMKPSAVYKRFYLNVPAEFTNKYRLPAKSEVALRMGEKTWVASFYCNNKGWRALRGIGWKKFVLDNVLEEFDICVFTLSTEKHDTATVMDVEIFRVIVENVSPSAVLGSTPA